MTGCRRSLLVLGLFISCTYPASSALGSETVNYTYDARGRLVKVSRSGTVNNGISACYAYDKADNRTNVTVATSDCGDPASPPNFAIASASGTEAETLVFSVSKTGSMSGSFSVDYTTANGTAAAGSDYTAASGTLTFAATDTSKTISITTVEDSIVEGSETFVINLSGATGGATITASQGTGTIADNDTPPSFVVVPLLGGTLIHIRS